MSDEDFFKIYDTLEKLDLTPEEAISYHSRLKVIMDEKASIEHAIYEGQQEAIKEQKKKMARTLIKMGESNKKIAAITGLSVKEVEIQRYVKEIDKSQRIANYNRLNFPYFNEIMELIRKDHGGDPKEMMAKSTFYKQFENDSLEVLEYPPERWSYGVIFQCQKLIGGY